MLLIRRFESPDLPVVWELHNLALQQVHAHAGPGAWDDDFKDITGTYIDVGGDFLVGLVDGRIIAMDALRRISEARAEIKRLRVHPDYQQQGFGQRMLYCAAIDISCRPVSR